MENLKFEGSTVEQCLKIASSTLNIPIEEIKYTVIEEKKGLLRRKAVILVELQFSCDDINSGTAKVEKGKLIIKNPKDSGKPAIVIPTPNIKLIIDGEEVRSKHEVFEESHIEVRFDETEGKRYLDINISENKIQAYVSIGYEPKVVYELKDVEENCLITLEAVVNKDIYPPKFTKNEIMHELDKLGVKYGIIEENLEKCVESLKIKELIIAQGLAVKDDTDDFIELKFEKEDSLSSFLEDESGTIDYRNVGAVSAIKKDEIVAIKHKGESGYDGKDIYGNDIKRKIGKELALRVGNGCILKDENTVVATMEGKPCIKKNTFYVYGVHEVTNDVDLKTGNIKFVGNVKIFGDVKESMLVEAGNAVEIEKNVENATIISKGNTDIKGNAVASKIFAGGQDVSILSYIDKLKLLESNTTKVIENVMEFKKFNAAAQKINDGELIKVLLEKKFKEINKICFDIILMGKMITDNKMLEQIIRGKLLGMAPLRIKHYTELELVINEVKQEVEGIQNLTVLPATTKVGYLQDSIIECSGDIYITGKGEYISKLTAYGNIYFTYDRSVARGGILSAKDEIKCKIVGSPGGVTTKLIVSDKGHVWIDEAYQNTVIVVGKKEFILEDPSRNIHAYLNSDRELIVDRLKL